MKYQDKENTPNAFYVGASVGTKLADALAPTDDGLDYLRDTEHVGTITQDAADADFPVPKEVD
jgi:hypothetical protein